MDWNEETIARIRALWAEGLSTAEIGRRMGISKNAVVGKAHRLNLPARPSPIRRETEGEAAVRPAAPPRKPVAPPPLRAPAPPPRKPAPPPAAAGAGAAAPYRGAGRRRAGGTAAVRRRGAPLPARL